MPGIGQLKCEKCGHVQSIDVLDLLPGKFSGWSYTCGRCSRRNSLHFLPSVLGFFFGFVAMVRLWHPAIQLGEDIFGKPLGLFGCLLFGSAPIAVGVVIDVAINFIYYRVRGHNSV